MNKYGYFRYSDIAVNAKSEAKYSLDPSYSLQYGSALEQLSSGVKPYDYASFELNSYNTSKPKRIFRGNSGLGLLTTETSSETGEFGGGVVIDIMFCDTENNPSYHNLRGLAIDSKNILQDVNITVFRDDTIVKSQNYTTDNYEMSSKSIFFDLLLGEESLQLESINRVSIKINKILEPEHFLGIFNFEFGFVRNIKEDIYSSATIKNNFSVLGDTIEYDTLDLVVVEFSTKDFLFQENQPIEYKTENGEVLSRFYVKDGEESDDISISLLAYDFVANLEDMFYGDIYTNYPIKNILSGILGDIEYTIESDVQNLSISGYIPITTRRKALQMVLQGCNLRCYKGEKIHFGKMNLTNPEKFFDETNIINKPKKTKKQEIKSVLINQHNYSKGQEEVELYHWWISKTEPVIITFSEPVYDIKAYEVETDEYGNDVVSETESGRVAFSETSANYCKVKSLTDNKVVIIGKKYVDNIVKFTKTNPKAIYGNLKKEITLDLTVHSNSQEVCNLIYDLETRKNSYVFQTIDDIEVGSCCNVLGDIVNIKSKSHNLNGIYEVEAV